MIKKLLFFSLLFLPFFSSAQSEVNLTKEYLKDISGITVPLKLNDKLNIIAIDGDKNQIAITAIDAGLNTIWSTNVTASRPLLVAKFKEKVLFVSSLYKSKLLTYQCSLLDPASGKIILEKEIYTTTFDHRDDSYFFTSTNGSFFTFAIRKTTAKETMAVNMYDIGAFADGKEIGAKKETTDIIVKNFDDNLEPVSEFHPAINDDSFISMVCNNTGDLFLSWYRDGNVNILKYPQGKDKPSTQINQSFDFKKNTEAFFAFLPSDKNMDVVYMTVNYKNLENDPEMMVSKLDFVKNTSKSITETFTRSHIKDLEKAFVPVNDKFTKPVDIIGKRCAVRLIAQTNDRLMVFISSPVYSTFKATYAGYIAQCSEGAIVIDGYDLDLNLKYTQLFPSEYVLQTVKFMNPGYHIYGDKLCLLADYKYDGALTGTMNIKTGEWTSMLLLPKKKLGSADFPQAEKVLWYSNGFILPYAKPRGMMKRSQDISMQQIAN